MRWFFLLLPLVAFADPPRPLQCLARYYAVRPVQRDGRWSGQLPDGSVLAYDDGKAKSAAERLETPDLKDWFACHYQKGAIRPVTVVDEDPGRIRVDALFVATYPKREVQKIQFLQQTLTVHKRAAPAFLRVAERLARAVDAHPALKPFLQKLGGTFVERNIAGTDRPSAHSYGVSLDINVERSHYWRWQKPPEPLRWQNRIPQAIVDAFEAEGFIWGGRWYHYDTMHFEYRPELLDESCYP